MDISKYVTLGLKFLPFTYIFGFMYARGICTFKKVHASEFHRNAVKIIFADIFIFIFIS